MTESLTLRARYSFSEASNLEHDRFIIVKVKGTFSFSEPISLKKRTFIGQIAASDGKQIVIKSAIDLDSGSRKKNTLVCNSHDEYYLPTDKDIDFYTTNS